MNIFSEFIPDTIRSNRSKNKTRESTEVSGKYLAKRNDEWYPAEVIQKRPVQDPNTFEYYVHYTNCDRRLDRWLPQEEVKFIPSSQDPEEPAPASTSTISAIIPDISNRKMTRTQKKRLDEINESLMDTETEPQEISALEEERKALTKVKYITEIRIGKYLIDTWYFSPYPDEYGKSAKLWICEYCLFYARYAVSLHLHERECEFNNPPGTEVYRSGAISIYEADGRVHKLYCQNLCLLAKLFLDHKTLFFDVEAFKFYVLCVVDMAGAHIVGFFSKEKDSPDCFNVACLLVLPPYQKHGYGRLLIAFSYELSKLEGIVAGPETPLSDLGLLAYRSYWSWVLLQEIYSSDDEVSITDLSFRTSINESDILDTLNWLNLVKYLKNNYCICVTRETLLNVFKKLKPPRFFINTAAIRWYPYDNAM